MKKISLTCLCLYIGISFSFSQTQKGNKFWVVEGRYSGSNFDNSSGTGTSIYNSRNSSNVYNEASLEFKRGKFIKNNVAMGWGLNYRYSNSNYLDSHYFSNNGDYISSIYRHTLGINYFTTRFIPVMNHLYLFVEADAGFSYGLRTGRYTNSPSTFEDLSKERNYKVGIRLNSGLRYFVGKSLFINAETTLAEASYSKQINENYTYSYFNLSSRLSLYSLNIGIGKNF
jgi:hypothetical protein